MSLTIIIPIESWELCQSEWSDRGMDTALGAHPRMRTLDGDLVIAVAHDWSDDDLLRIEEMRVQYGWPVTISRKTLSDEFA